MRVYVGSISMSYVCMRCGHVQGAHDTNLYSHADRIFELAADAQLDGFEMTLVDCTLNPRPEDYVHEVAELCGEKSPVQALGIGAGYVSPDIASEYREEQVRKTENQGMWPPQRLLQSCPMGGSLQSVDNRTKPWPPSPGGLFIPKRNIYN